MSCINTNQFGAAEHCAADNWAAEYAKKLFANEGDTRAAKDAELESGIDALDEIIGDTNELMTTADTVVGAINEVLDDMDEVSDELSSRVKKTDYASTARAGIIKLRTNGSGANQSGILVDSAGAAAIGVPTDDSAGIRRDASGQVKLCHATAEEVKAGTNAVKVVTPAALKEAIGSPAVLKEVPGSLEELKEVIGSGDFEKMPMPNGLSLLPATDITTAINILINHHDPVKKMYALNESCFERCGIGSNIMRAKGGIVLPLGRYLLVMPYDGIKAISIAYDRTDSSKYAQISTYDFVKDALYIVEFNETGSRVLFDGAKITDTNYSTTPQRVGTWIDGTPVWKAAIPMTAVEDIGCTNPKAAWGTSFDDILVKLGLVNNASDIIYINGMVAFQNGDDYNADAFALNATQSYPGYYRFTAMDNDYTSHFYGWIEFATLESNIV